MPFVPDQPRKSRFVPDAPSTGPDPFAGDSLLSNDSMASLAAGAQSTVTPTQKPSLVERVFGYGKNYLQDLRQAGQALSQPSNDIPGAGTAEMLGTMATGLVSPIPAALESAALGTPYRQAREKYVYQPQTQSGRAMVGGVGALTKPVGDVFAAGGKLVGRTLDPIPGVSSESAQEAGAAAMDAFGLAASARGLAPRQPAPAPRKPAEVPSTKELEAAKNAAYARAQAAGVVVTPQSFAKFTNDTIADLAGKHLNAKLHPGTAAAVEELVATTKRGGPLTLEEIDQLRRIVRDAPQTKDDRRMAKSVVDRLDNYLNGLQGKDLSAGDAPEAMAALKQARELNRRKENSALLDELMRKAGIQATAKFTQAGEEHALRSEFKRIALNAKTMQKFTPAEREAIEKVAKGGSLENAMRDLGKFDPLQGGMASAVSAITGGSLGGIGFLAAGPEAATLGLAIPAMGIAGRRIATNLTRRNVGQAREALVGRGLPTGLLGNAPASAPQSTVAPAALLLPGMLGQQRP